MSQRFQPTVNRAGDYWVSLVRTYVPIILGGIVSWLTLRGLELSDAQQSTLKEALIVIGAMLWYAVARLFEVLGGKFGIHWLVVIGGLMNGYPRSPEYSTTSVTDYAEVVHE